MIKLIKLVDCLDGQRYQPPNCIFSLRATFEVDTNKIGETKSENWTHIFSPSPQSWLTPINNDDIFNDIGEDEDFESFSPPKHQSQIKCKFPNKHN